MLRSRADTHVAKTGVPLAIKTRLSSHQLSYGETIHTGWALVVDDSGKMLWQTTGANHAQTFFRSAAKPFQAALLLDLPLESQLLPQELAIVCGSHSGTAEQLGWVSHLLNRLSGLAFPNPEIWLQCGAHLPLDKPMQMALLTEHKPGTPIHNNCSGKHAGMLWYCHCLQWDMSTYHHLDHPLQQAILSLLQEETGLSEIPVALDGCGVPTFYMPLLDMGKLYAKLPSEMRYQPVVTAMTDYPQLVAADNRIDTVLMKISEGILLSKVGADGLLCIANMSKKQALVVKLADGAGDVRDFVALGLLYRLGWLSQAQLENPVMASWLDVESLQQGLCRVNRLNTRSERVGHLELLVSVE